MKGLDAALSLGIKEVAVFGAATEAFSQKNINCSVKESMDRFEEVCKTAHKENVRIRGYISCVLGCPYEGAVSPDKVGNNYIKYGSLHKTTGMYSSPFHI
jgi:hydroxymethylglutaryl-CoA lyase